MMSSRLGRGMLCGVKRWQKLWYGTATVWLAAMIALCLLGAFLGAGRARVLVHSPPLYAFWAVAAGLLLVGTVRSVFSAPFRSPGAAAVHVGALLILGGGLWSSPPVHAWRAKTIGLSPPGPPEGYLQLHPHDPGAKSSRRLWKLFPDRPPEPIGELPFAVSVLRAWTEYYPPPAPEWELFGLSYDEHGRSRDLVPLSGRIAQPCWFPAAEGTVTVLGYDPSRRQIELQLTRGGETKTNRITVGPSDEPTVLPLEDAFASSRAWREAGRPSLVFLPPPQTVRDYKAELFIPAEDGKKPPLQGVVAVNHPLHARGYHFYLSSCDPPAALTLRVVRDDGLSFVYAGFALLGFGTILRLWIEPAFAGRKRREERHE